MANILNQEKQMTIIGALAEGSSIRAIERMTGVHRDTIMRLGAHDTDDPKKPRRHVTVLHIAPVTSAGEAVRAAIVQEFRSLAPDEET